MSFQIDLLQDHERKVGSMATIKAVVQGAILLLSGLLVLLVAHLSFAVVARNRNLLDLEESWSSLDKRQEMALMVQQQMVYNETTLAELDQWEQSRQRWDKQLLAIACSTPTGIQFRAVSIEAVPLTATPDAPAPQGLHRRFKIALNGRAAGEAPLADITQTRNNLRKFPTMSNIVESVAILDFAADALTKDDMDDRSFSIIITYPTLPLP